MDTVPIAQVYAVVKDYTDYRGHPSTDAEVKEFVDRFLAKLPQKPDPKGCIYADRGRCCFVFNTNSTDDAKRTLPCVGLDACRKADMLLGVKI